MNLNKHLKNPATRSSKKNMEKNLIEVLESNGTGILEGVCRLETTDNDGCLDSNLEILSNGKLNKKFLTKLGDFKEIPISFSIGSDYLGTFLVDIRDDDYKYRGQDESHDDGLCLYGDIDCYVSIYFYRSKNEKDSILRFRAIIYDFERISPEIINFKRKRRTVNISEIRFDSKL